jgi:ABC-type multidrug transport system fused ATPase/permease subunit
LVDDINIGTVPRSIVRSKIESIPQEPFVIPGTLRNNIDPQNSQTNSDLVNFLTIVRLWETVELYGGLDVDIQKMHFSAGQLQLLSLARILSQRGKIIIMDEVSSK